MPLNLPRLKDYVIRPLCDVEVTQFDCDDEKLNKYFREDAKDNEEELLSKTYFLTKEIDREPIVGFSISNAHIDAVLEIDITLSPEQQYKTYPAVRIGKFATSKQYKRCGFGLKTMLLLKSWFRGANKTGCRFIVVDSRKTEDAKKFYLKNKFEEYPIQIDSQDTILMYFDLKTFSL